MKCQWIADVNDQILGKVKIAFQVLGKRNVQQSVFPRCILLHSSELCHSIQQVTRRFKIEADGIGISDTGVIHQCSSGTVVDIAIAGADNKAVFIIVFEDVVLVFLQIILFECLVYAGHIQIVDVQQINAMLRTLLLYPPFVAPSGRCYNAREFGSHLVVILQSEFCSSPYPPLEIAGYKGKHKPWEVDGCFRT